MPNLIDLTGKKFGKLTVLYRAPSPTKKTMWLCRCDCGQTVSVRACSLASAHTVACGCLRRQRLADHRNKHGYAATDTYKIWQGMKARCLNSSKNCYADYGGRGIMVCDRWLESFGNFLADMGERPAGKTLEREDVNGHYEPRNCKWASTKDQSNNKRTSVRIEFRGRTQTVSQWAEELGMNQATLYARLVRQGWSTQRAMLTPVQPHGRAA